jgi:mono/diheme cytochrome c family protein
MTWRSRLSWLLALATTLPALADEPPSGPDGAHLFSTNCVVCHGASGQGIPSLAPPLTSYPAQYAKTEQGRRQLAMTVLYGMFGDVIVDRKHYNFKMPQFLQLDDRSLAAVLNFVIFELDKPPPETKPLSAQDIANERADAADGEAVRQHRLAVLKELKLQP